MTPKIYLLVVLLLSVFSFVLYGWDKRQARADSRRIPESTLHLLAVLGGWPGSIVGQQLFRHKTRKISFQIRFWLLVLVHVVVVAAVWFRWTL